MCEQAKSAIDSSKAVEGAQKVVEALEALTKAIKAEREGTTLENIHQLLWPCKNLKGYILHTQKSEEDGAKDMVEKLQNAQASLMEVVNPDRFKTLEDPFWKHISDLWVKDLEGKINLSCRQNPEAMKCFWDVAVQGAGRVLLCVWLSFLFFFTALQPGRCGVYIGAYGGGGVALLYDDQYGHLPHCLWRT